MTITDLGSPSGVAIGNARIAPQSPVPADPRMIVSFGPVVAGVGSGGSCCAVAVGVVP